MRLHHDIGGEEAGATDIQPKELSFAEKRIDAVTELLRDQQRRVFSTDEMRWAVESLPGDIYDGSGYYHRQLFAVCDLLAAKGIITPGELLHGMLEALDRSRSDSDDHTHAHASAVDAGEQHLDASVTALVGLLSRRGILDEGEIGRLIVKWRVRPLRTVR